MNDFYLNNIDKSKNVHLVGIGGISMSGLARILMNKGFSVTGSDISESEAVLSLRAAGAKVTVGHKKENAEGASLVVYTAAVKEDNPELVYAKENGIKAIERSVLLGAIMREFKKSIGIAGTHGKTTTTSMMSHVLLKADLDPTITIGGNLDLIGGNIRVGESEYFLTEACEYHSSFLEFFPTVCVVTNVDADHLDYFRDLDHIKEVFSDYLAIPDENGFAVVCADDKNATDCLGKVRGRVLTYGIDADADFKAENVSYDENGFGNFTVSFFGESIEVKLNVPGRHNVLNALSCFAAGYALGIKKEVIREGVSEFSLVHRRFEKKGEVNGATVIDDYAHHPTEIMCTLETAKNIAKERVRVIFQPHTYTRTRALFDEFKKAFSSADEIIVCDIYAAREKDTGLVSAKELSDAILKEGKDAKYIKDFDEIASYIKDTSKEGDIVITMGAGDVCKISDILTK